MKPEHARQRLEFGRIADEWSSESSLSRDEILELLVGAIWQGEFEDVEGKTSIDLEESTTEDPFFNRRDLLSFWVARAGGSPLRPDCLGWRC